MEDNYYYIDQRENSDKTWTNNYMGKIVQSNYNPKTNKISQCGVEFNFPQSYINFLNNSKKEKDFGFKVVNKNLYDVLKYNNKEK